MEYELGTVCMDSSAAERHTPNGEVSAPALALGECFRPNGELSHLSGTVCGMTLVWRIGEVHRDVSLFLECSGTKSATCLRAGPPATI